MPRRLIGLLSALLVTAMAALAAAAGPGSPDASASSLRGFSKVKFALDYRGTISATWRKTRPVTGGLTCIGNDLSGTFTSTLRRGSKPYTLLLYKDLGGRRLLMEWKPNLALVSSNRTAQGWMMRYSGGQCHQVPIDPSACGAHTFNGGVGLEPAGGNFGFNRDRVFLNWDTEPEAIGCYDGIAWDHRPGTPYGQHYARLVLKTLYRCGIRKGRRCRMTIGSSSDYPFQATQNEETYTSNVHIEWSVTFRVVSRR